MIFNVRPKIGFFTKFVQKSDPLEILTKKSDHFQNFTKKLFSKLHKNRIIFKINCISCKICKKSDQLVIFFINISTELKFNTLNNMSKISVFHNTIKSLFDIMSQSQWVSEKINGTKKLISLTFSTVGEKQLIVMLIRRQFFECIAAEKILDSDTRIFELDKRERKLGLECFKIIFLSKYIN